jgi:hypothetical protein
MIKEFKVGEVYKVKSNTITKLYGVSTYGAENKADCKAWPGEIAQCVLVPYTAWDGTLMSTTQLQFSRGRHTSTDVANKDYFLKAKR